MGDLPRLLFVLKDGVLDELFEGGGSFDVFEVVFILPELLLIVDPYPLPHQFSRRLGTANRLFFPSELLT